MDADFGPFFMKFCSYFPYTGKLCINGHHWAQRQAAKAGIGFTAMDNAFAAVDDPAALQPSATGSDRRDPGAAGQVVGDPAQPVHRADRDAGYRYQLSILQAEFSLTQMLDAPVTGRVFFEQVIRDNLDIGRPDQVSLIFDRRVCAVAATSTPGRFRTRVITDGVTPSLHVDYKTRHDQAVPQVATRGRTLRVDSQSGGPTDVGGVVPGRCSMVRARPDVRRR